MATKRSSGWNTWALTSPKHKFVGLRGAGVKDKDFLYTKEWARLRQRVLQQYGAQCMACGALPTIELKINVDHIKPRTLFPELALDFNNLQVLCECCNKVKGNKDQTDYRDNRAYRK